MHAIESRSLRLIESDAVDDQRIRSQTAECFEPLELSEHAHP